MGASAGRPTEHELGEARLPATECGCSRVGARRVVRCGLLRGWARDSAAAQALVPSRLGERQPTEHVRLTTLLPAPGTATPVNAVEAVLLPAP